MYGVIYKITNLVNGKIYIGQTKNNVELRFYQHRYSDSVIGKAIRKYGIKNFKIDIVEECESFEKMNEREIFWIKELNCKYPNGYNLTDGGEGVVNPSEEIRQKISNTKKGRPGRPQSKEERKKRIASLIAYYASNPEVLEKKSAEMKGNSRAAGHKNFAGHKHTAESKSKISASLLAYWAKKNEQEVVVKKETVVQMSLWGEDEFSN